MTCYLLNAPILTDLGTFIHSGPLSVEDIQKRLPERWVSAIGHSATAKLISAKLGIRVPQNRVEVHMAPGDTALILRLKERLPEGALLDEDALQKVGYEFTWLERIA